MNKTTLVLIILSVLVAGGLSYFQYFYKARSKSKTNLLLAFLRFISVLGLLLLLINPIISRKTYENQKTPLAVVVDNSNSINELKATVSSKESLKKLTENKELNEKFELQLYKFDQDVTSFESEKELNYQGKQSQIDKVAKSLNSINKNVIFPTVLISDGNQTSGEDFVFAFNPNNKVYPLVVGDTTTFLDLKINQINVNKYAFHKNKFPVETFVQYSGTKSVSAKFTISQGNNVLFSQPINFSPNNKAQVINALIPANSVGLQLFVAKITSSESEKNTLNNSKKFAVDVIDQRTEVAIISAINHPDVGALKRSIESNASRKVTLLKPNTTNEIGNYNVIILYQPTVEFKTLLPLIEKQNKNYFVISGNATDFNLLNQFQNQINYKVSSQKEDYLANYESNFNLFALDNIGFEKFPPLEHPFGTISLKSNASVLLKSRIRVVNTEAPLLALSDNQGKRSAFLMGENIWKWRADSFVNKKSFEEFDVFTDKIIQFLASNDSKKSLVVNHERFYNSGDALEISAQYFNKNYELDEKARLTIVVTNKKTKATKRYDLLRSSNAFKVNLDGLAAGNYSFTVKELNSNSSYSSSFDVLDFDIEKQFVNPDMTRLKQLATQTKAKVFVPNQVDVLINELLINKEYQTIQKEIVKKTPIIDWIWLLLLIALSLAAEWFIRKYNGLL
jgi:hypothetical protein